NGCLAGAARPQNSHELAFRDGEIDLGRHWDVAVGLVNVLELQQGLRRASHQFQCSPLSRGRPTIVPARAAAAAKTSVSGLASISCHRSARLVGSSTDSSQTSVSLSLALGKGTT